MIMVDDRAPEHHFENIKDLLAKPGIIKIMKIRKTATLKHVNFFSKNRRYGVHVSFSKLTAFK